MTTYERIRGESESGGTLAFMDHPVDPDEPIEAIYINLDQLEAMRLLLESNPELKGFRLYYGQMGDENKPEPISMVVGVMEQELDELSIIFRTVRTGASLCPTICDASSPIPQH